MLKLLIYDLNKTNFSIIRETTLRKKMQHLQARFVSALRFLKKTSVPHLGQRIRLKNLPWFLVVGPKDAGKTTLLAQANIHYILQRHFKETMRYRLPASHHPDWWITRDAAFIDVPSNYLFKTDAHKSQASSTKTYSIWQFFLSLIQTYRGKSGLNGIVIALPFPDVMRQNEVKQFHLEMRDLCQRLHELQKYFNASIPCYILITKCDLLPGFKEFFAESTHEEINQAWGIALADSPLANVHQLFNDRFNALIKKLNQQLLWRLHQERNPMVRPAIKDFPLQVERLKALVADFLKKMGAAQLKINIRGVYLTSAMQPASEKEPTVIEEINSTLRTVALFKAPTLQSRAYFLKQFLTQGLHSQPRSHTTTAAVWRRRFAYVVAFGMVASTALLFSRDFEQGVKQAYSIQNYLTDYQLAIQKNQNSLEHLMLASNLLNTLDSLAQKTIVKFNLSTLLTFYSQKSEEKAHQVYAAALRDILLPEVGNFLADILKNPVNKNAEFVYATLKAYLMLGDPAHFDQTFFLTTTEQALQANFDKAKLQRFIQHLQLATAPPKELPLNTKLIVETRQFLQSLPSFQLAYVILKNTNSNNVPHEINIGTTKSAATVFTTHDITNQIPKMFTSSIFSQIIASEVTTAAEETTQGNWVLGKPIQASQVDVSTLADQLRTAYVNNYIDLWESVLANIQLHEPRDLSHLDAMIQLLLSNDSPLLQLLRTVHDNTFFEPVSSASPKLQSMALLLTKSHDGTDQLYQIFSGLQHVHAYLNSILKAENHKKAAYDAMSYHMQNSGAPDALSSLRLIADKSPDPVKIWLNKISNTAWQLLMRDAGQYLDTSWNDKVMDVYRTHIADRYPFNQQSEAEVSLPSFIHFFGNPGLVINFYNQYLQHLIDKKNHHWQWKTLHGMPLPLSSALLPQIQKAMLIHHAFFPNGDDKLFVQFNVQPYQFGKQVMRVKLSINGKEMMDDQSSGNAHHLVTWTDTSSQKHAAYEITLANQNPVRQNFPGEWGWFRLVNQAFESSLSKKQLVINLSPQLLAKYLIYTEGQSNPLLSLKMPEFDLPKHLYIEPNNNNGDYHA